MRDCPACPRGLSAISHEADALKSTRYLEEEPGENLFGRSLHILISMLCI